MRPLDGIRVTDFTHLAAGPFCTLMLSLLGAEVIRIESNARLDIQRRPHPVYGRFEVPNFDYLAGGKQSVTLNLKTEVGLALAGELVDISDVVVENFRPGVMTRLGLGWPELSRRNPRLVMLSLSAYGAEGPDSGRPGYAPIFAAEGGLGYMTGYPDGPPVEIRNNMDHEAGLLSAFVVLALVEERERTGRGAYADIAAREVASMLVGESILQALAGGEPMRAGTSHDLWCPHGIYATAGHDRWIAIAVQSDVEWTRLVEAMRKPSWCTDDLCHAAERRHRRSELDERLTEWTRTQDALALAKELQARGICADVSKTAEDLIADPHLKARGSITSIADPEFGERLTVGVPWRFENSDVRYDRWSPRLGEHNEAVICGLLGHAPEELKEWIEEEFVH